jgi:hypothetical protein
MKNMDRLEVMKVMFRLIHSCNYETPEIINARGKCAPFSMPFAISNSKDMFRNYCLVRIANSGGESVMAELKDLSMKHFGMCISKYDRLPKKLDAIIVPARYFQEILFKMTLKSYLIVSKDILPNNLQKKQDGEVSMQDLERFFHHSDNGPSFCKHLYLCNYCTCFWTFLQQCSLSSERGMACCGGFNAALPRVDFTRENCRTWQKCEFTS